MAKRDELADDSDMPVVKIGIGHNSVSTQELTKLCEELEAVAEQKKLLSQAATDIMTAAQQKGFDPKHIREVLKLRAMDQDKRNDFLEQRDLYLHALGLV